MPALMAGKKAPDFILPTMAGAKFSLADALQHGPVIAAFFKVSCPVCQYAFPYLERIHKAYGNKVAIVGISQNSKPDTSAFIREYGVTFPVLLDDPGKYPVSNAYGLTNVPTVFVIAEGSRIELSSVGWSRQDIDQVNVLAAQAAGSAPRPIFHPDDWAAEFRPG